MSAQVRQRLTDAIHNGDLAPGAPLPAERALCEEFGVARTSVREAIQGLVIAGFVERRGNRSVVTERLPELHLGGESSSEIATQVVELLSAIEPAIAELAARRATPAERAEIADIAAQPVTTIVALRRLDIQLRTAIARACANPLLCEVHAKTLALVRGDLLALVHPAAADGHDHAVITVALTHVRALAAAVCAGDAAAAASAQATYLAGIAGRMTTPS